MSVQFNDRRAVLLNDNKRKTKRLSGDSFIFLSAYKINVQNDEKVVPVSDESLTKFINRSVQGAIGEIGLGSANIRLRNNLSFDLVMKNKIDDDKLNTQKSYFIFDCKSEWINHVLSALTLSRNWGDIQIEILNHDISELSDMALLHYIQLLTK